MEVVLQVVSVLSLQMHPAATAGQNDKILSFSEEIAHLRGKTEQNYNNSNNLEIGKSFLRHTVRGHEGSGSRCTQGPKNCPTRMHCWCEFLFLLLLFYFLPHLLSCG